MNETLCSIDWEKLVKVLSALLTPAIAIVTAYIAWQQHVINRRQHRLALFEKRMIVFNSTMNLIAGVLQKNDVDLDQLFKMIRETRDHELLFGSEIGEYITDVYKKGLALNTINFVHGDAGKRFELLKWFSEQSAEATKLFKRCMDFREPWHACALLRSSHATDRFSLRVRSSLL